MARIITSKYFPKCDILQTKIDKNLVIYGEVSNITLDHQKGYLLKYWERQ